MSAAVDVMEEPKPEEQPPPWRALVRQELDAALGRPRLYDHEKERVRAGLPRPAQVR